jgi:membrane protease YdiL (CAAX protease family)
VNTEAAHGASQVQTAGRVQIVEVSVFLFLIVPSLALSFFITKQGSASFPFVAASTILRDLALVSLILYFLWRNREGVGQIGWKADHLWNEVAIGAVLFFPLFFGATLLDGALLKAGLSAPRTPLPAFLTPTGWAQLVLAFALVLVVALAEETIFRGYLMLRFGAVTASRTRSLLLSAAVFALGHGYEGSAGVVTVGVMGVAFGLAYMWRRSLVAPITMHFLQDFVSIILLPLIGTAK